MDDNVDCFTRHNPPVTLEWRVKQSHWVREVNKNLMKIIVFSRQEQWVDLRYHEVRSAAWLSETQKLFCQHMDEEIPNLFQGTQSFLETIKWLLFALKWLFLWFLMSNKLIIIFQKSIFLSIVVIWHFIYEGNYYFFFLICYLNFDHLKHQKEKAYGEKERRKEFKRKNERKKETRGLVVKA